MPHIHDKIDFTVAIFVVQQAKVLLVHHRALGKWLPLGGHIELDEDPEQAALREAREESGLDIELLGERPPTTEPGTRALLAPRFLDIHRISATHEHIGMIYFARPRDAGAALQLAPTEHHAIRWCTCEELQTLSPPLSGAVQWYCEQAIREITSTKWDVLLQKSPKCFVSEITPGFSEQYYLQKQHVLPRRTGEVIAVRSTKDWCRPGKEKDAMTLGIALLGTGTIAQHAFVPAVHAVDAARLVAVLSRDQARGAAFAQQHGIPEAYDTLDALLRDPQVEAVIVATPDAMHEPQVIAAVQAGKHVLCEKPMTTTYAGCQRMATAIRASGITFAMGYNNRFNTGLQHIKALLETQAIGPVRYARALLTAQAQDPRGWRAHSEQASYWALSAVGTHLIDVWRWYFGEPASVGGGLASPAYQSPNDEVATLVFDYPGRLLAELAVAAVFRGGNRLELYGEGGAIIGDNVFGSRPRGPITCKGQDVAYQPVNPFVEEVADFVQAIRQQREPRVTLEDGLRNVSIMETARASQLQHPLE